MQKLLLATAIAVSTSFASTAALAADDSNGGAFVHLGAGKTNYLTQVKTFDGKKATSLDVLGGYRWGLGHGFAVGVEGGFAHLGTVEKKGQRPAPKQKGARDSMTSHAWLVGANAKWNVTENVSLTGRAGSARIQTRIESRAAGEKNPHYRATFTRPTTYFGLGAGYAITDHLDLTVQATRYRNSSVQIRNAKGRYSDWAATTYNAGVEYRF
jgi:hypothetical protein